MITDPDSDGNYPLILNNKSYSLTGKIISFYINL